MFLKVWFGALFFDIVYSFFLPKAPCLCFDVFIVSFNVYVVDKILELFFFGFR